MTGKCYAGVQSPSTAAPGALTTNLAVFALGRGGVLQKGRGNAVAMEAGQFVWMYDWVSTTAVTR